MPLCRSAARPAHGHSRRALPAPPPSGGADRLLHHAGECGVCGRHGCAVVASTPERAHDVRPASAAGSPASGQLTRSPWGQSGPWVIDASSTPAGFSACRGVRQSDSGEIRVGLNAQLDLTMSTPADRATAPQARVRMSRCVPGAIARRCPVRSMPRAGSPSRSTADRPHHGRGEPARNVRGGPGRHVSGAHGGLPRPLGCAERLRQRPRASVSQGRN